MLRLRLRGISRRRGDGLAGNKVIVVVIRIGIISHVHEQIANSRISVALLRRGLQPLLVAREVCVVSKFKLSVKTTK